MESCAYLVEGSAIVGACYAAHILGAEDTSAFAAGWRA